MVLNRLLRTLALGAAVAGLTLTGACGGDSAAGGGADSTAVAGSSSASSQKQGNAAKKSKKKKPRKEKAVSVEASTVVRGDLVVPVVAEGSIRARHSAAVRTEIAGRLDRVSVEEGQTVRRGAVLARLDDREYRVALTEAEDQYLQALSRLAVDEETLDSSSADKQLAKRLAELDRQLADGAITAAEHRDKRLTLEVEAVRNGAYRDELVQVRSGLSAARAAKERAKLNLERTVIRAPFGGVVSGMQLTAGQRLASGALVCNLVDNLNLEAEVAVLESDLRGLEEGRRALLEVPALGETLRVTVDVISPEIDTDSRTCSLLLRCRNTDGRLRPGMFVRAAIAGTTYPDRLLVPREAILTRDGRPMLFKVVNSRAEWVYVRLGHGNDRMIEIEKILQGGPLAPDTKVVVSNHLTLTHKAKVKVKRVVPPDLLWVDPASR